MNGAPLLGAMSLVVLGPHGPQFIFCVTEILDAISIPSGRAEPSPWVKYAFRVLTYTLWGYTILAVRYPEGVYGGENMSLDKDAGSGAAEAACPCCSGKHKDREAQEKRDLMNRLKRIEGQVRGVEGMLENDAYCTDILMQVSAITSALNSFNKVLLSNHVKTCVADNIRQGNDEVVDELVTTLQKLMK